MDNFIFCATKKGKKFYPSVIRAVDGKQISGEEGFSLYEDSLREAKKLIPLLKKKKIEKKKIVQGKPFGGNVWT